MIFYRIAKQKDLPAIKQFVDYWLSGRAKRNDKAIASNDYFVSDSQHSDYLKEKKVLLAIRHYKIVGWAVLSKHDILVHILVSGHCRNRGIGKRMIQILNPTKIRSKSDQGTGDPGPWYERLGFQKTSTEKAGKNKNIEIYENVGH